MSYTTVQNSRHSVSITMTIICALIFVAVVIFFVRMNNDGNSPSRFVKDKQISSPPTSYQMYPQGDDASVDGGVLSLKSVDFEVERTVDKCLCTETSHLENYVFYYFRLDISGLSLSQIVDIVPDVYYTVDNQWYLARRYVRSSTVVSEDKIIWCCELPKNVKDIQLLLQIPGGERIGFVVDSMAS